MVPDKYKLAAVGKYLLDAFERRRPAIQRWDAATEQSMREEADAEIAQMQRQLAEMGMEDPSYWVKVRKAVREVIIPRWTTLAMEENERAAKDYGLWRGGDLVARGAFAGVGLVLGAAAVAVPWIPVSEKWIPWLLFVGGPFVPDAYFWWYHRRYQKKLDALVSELAQAGESLELYRPLSEVQASLGLGAVELEGPGAASEPADQSPAGPQRTRS